MAYSLSLATYESQDPGNNQSTVTAVLYLRAWNGGGNYAYWNYNTSWSITIAGNTASGAGPRSINTNGSGGVNSTDSTVEVGRHSVTFTHDANGYRGAVYSSAGFDGSGGYSPGHLDASGGAFGAIDYTRLPYTPSTPAFSSRDRNSIVMTTSAGVPGNAPGVSYYNWQYSTDGGNWYGIGGQTSSTLSWTDAGINTQYYFRSQGVSTEGGGPWSAASTIVAAAPSQPNSPGISRLGTSVNLTFTTPASNGSSLSTYTLQRATDSGFTQNVVTTTGISVSYVNNIQLAPGTTYYFRVKVGSNRGDSDYSASSNVVVPPIPLAPTITTPLIKEVRKITIDWDAPSVSGGAVVSGYEVYARYSSNGGQTWDTSFTLLTTTTSGTTLFKTADLNIAKTYQFQVRALTDVGNTEYSSTDTLTIYNSIFISAYGYKYDGTNFNTAIQFAAKYTGNSGDSIVVGGTTYTGWKTIENVKRYDGNDLIPLTQ